MSKYTVKMTSKKWDSIEYNRINSFKKIGFYDAEKNHFEEVARWRNSCTKNGANYGLLQIWSITFDFIGYEKQGSNNVCGGYNKPIANLEGCLYQLKKAVENNEVITDCGNFTYSNCGSITSLIDELKDYLQKQYKKPLFVIDVC